MDIKFMLKTVFGIFLLFSLFLWSGGIYEYKVNSNGLPQFRINKITNNIQVLDSKGWKDILIEK